MDWEHLFSSGLAGQILEFIFLTLFVVCLTVLIIYAFMQLSLIINYLFKAKPAVKKFNSSEELPQVTIQLPMFNELHVAERIIDHIIHIDYPCEKLQIQILDDSTDETTNLIRNKVEYYAAKGFDMELIHRKNRSGYKAGALKDAMPQVKGDFIAIFDADFLPERDFLQKTLPYFSDSSIGVVQTRWGHINKNYSLLTTLQALGLDGHFSIEQTGRSAGGHLINFNGTGGVWRKSCIEDAGGWQDDTLTEDLDLSYRAQLKNWKFIFLEDVEAPAELPVTMAGLKTQQHRWMKGGAECFKKNSSRIIKAKNIRFIDKLFGLLHLFNSSIFVVALTYALLCIPMLSMISSHPILGKITFVSSVFIMTVLYLFYWISYRDKNKNPIVSMPLFTIRFFMFLSISMGLSLNNAIAVIEGHLGIKSSFVRTPKFDIIGSNRFEGSRYHMMKISPQLLFEGILAMIFTWTTIGLLAQSSYKAGISYALLAIGFLFVFILSARESIQIKTSMKYEEQPA